MATKNVTETSAQDTQDTSAQDTVQDTAQDTSAKPSKAGKVPESKSNTPVSGESVGLPRDVVPALREVSDVAVLLASQVRAADIVRGMAEKVLHDVDRVQSLLHLAREVLAGQAKQESDTVICGREMVRQCERTISEYRASTDAEHQLYLLDVLRGQYASLGAWLTTSGGVMVDAVTGEKRKRSAEERDTIRMAKRIAAVAPKLTPFHLSEKERSAVDAFRQQRAERRAQSAKNVPSARRTVDADTAPTAQLPSAN